MVNESCKIHYYDNLEFVYLKRKEKIVENNYSSYKYDERRMCRVLLSK